MNKSCPCNYVEPCSNSCTCVNPTLSGGCRRCCSYGSEQQRKDAASHIISQEECYDKLDKSEQRVQYLESENSELHHQLIVYTDKCVSLEMNVAELRDMLSKQSDVMDSLEHEMEKLEQENRVLSNSVRLT